MTPNELKLDWINLPLGVAPDSLCFHDGKLLSVHSDLLQRTIDLEVNAPDLNEHAQMGDEGRFILHLQNVESARVTTSAIWPGQPPEVEGKPRAEQSRLVQEYQAKWREESVSWNDFEAAFSSNALDISHAEIVRQQGSVAIAFSGHLVGDDFDTQYFSFHIRAGQITVGQNNGRTDSIEHFLGIIKIYGEWFNLQYPR